MKEEKAHGDLKPDNIMSDNEYKMVLIDMGHSGPIKKDINHIIGSDLYRAPEV